MLIKHKPLPYMGGKDDFMSLSLFLRFSRNFLTVVEVSSASKLHKSVHGAKDTGISGVQKCCGLSPLQVEPTSFFNGWKSVGT